MADLVTHLATVLLPGAVIRSPLVGVAAVGVVLPDVLGRAVPLALEQLCARGLDLPPEALYAWSALHEPFGWACTVAAIAALAVDRDRRRIATALAAGCALHTGVDLLQDHHGEGYLLFAPFSTADVELGWIGSEATVGVAWPLLVVTAIAWLPALVERLFGTPRMSPTTLLALAVPIGVAAGIGTGTGWVAAAVCATAASLHRWCAHRPGAYALAGVCLAVVAGWAVSGT